MARVSRGRGAALKLALLLTLGMTAFSAGAAEASTQYNYGCDFCHQMPPRDSGTPKKNPFNGAVPGNHQGHASAAADSCNICHGDLVTGNSHRNKVIELRDDLGYTFKLPGTFLNQTSVPPNPLGTCSNISCHSDGKGTFKPTAPWGSTGMDCSSCHDAKGLHLGQHAAYYGSGTGSCVKCHADHTVEGKPFSHATSAGKRAVEVKFQDALNSGGSFDAGQCSNLYCHSDGRGKARNASWVAGSTLDCSGCHGAATSSGADALSGVHGKHVNNSAQLGTDYGCIECHAGPVANDGSIVDKSKHTDGLLQFAGSKLGGVNAGTCSTSYCHSDGKGALKSVSWTQSEELGCNGCHGTSNATGSPDYLSGAAGSASANSHNKHVNSAADCVSCHSNTISTGLTLKAGGQHIDGFNNYSGGGNSFGKLPGKGCSNIDCHSGNGIVKNVVPATWGAVLDCSGCHLTLSAGHAAHSDQYGCVSCHASVVSSNTVISTPAKHLNAAVEVTGAKLTGYIPEGQACATSCHMSSVPQWSEPASGACGSCHDVTNISTGGHAAHFSAPYGPQMAQQVSSCTICHIYNGSRVAPHVDGVNDQQPGYLTNGACSSCHKQDSTRWAVASSSTCESCHSTAGGALSVIGGVTAADKIQAALSGHGKPGIGLGCAACHDKNSAHISGALGDNDRLLPAFIGSANTECNACHSDAAKVSALNLNIKTHRASGPGTLCSDCHDAHGSAPNTMMVSQTINGTPVSFTGNSTFANAERTGVCQVCHITSQYFTKAGQPETTHVESTVNCLECHQHNPDSGFAFSANGACDACHGYPPAPRVTTSALTFGVQGNWSSARFEDYSGGGGAHLVDGHVPRDLRLTNTDADWTPCLPCHFDGKNLHARSMPTRSNVENVSVKMDPQYRFSADHFMSYTSAVLTSGGGNKSGTCFNTSCHMGPTRPWSIER